MRIVFDVVGPYNDDGTGWDVMMTVGAPGNKFILARQKGYKQKTSAIKVVKKLARMLRPSVDGASIDLEAVITDHRQPKTRVIVEEKELRKKV